MLTAALPDAPYYRLYDPPRVWVAAVGAEARLLDGTLRHHVFKDYDFVRLSNRQGKGHRLAAPSARKWILVLKPLIGGNRGSSLAYCASVSAPRFIDISV
jgi:hypothetical protein